MATCICYFLRLEEVLNLENKIIKNKNKNNNSKRIEIIEEDINDYGNILVDRRDVIKKFDSVLNQNRFEVIISMILLTISTLCVVYAPKIAGNIINLILLNFNSSNNHVIFRNLALLFILYVIGYLFKLPSNRFMVFVGEKIAYNLRMELFDKLDGIDLKFIHSNSKGIIFSRLNNDLMNIREFITCNISEIFAQFLAILFVIILILITEWRLGLIYLITFPIYIICFYYCDIRSIKSYDNHQRNLGWMMSYFERSLENRSIADEKEFEKINKTIFNNYVKSRSISSVILPITRFLTNLSNITVYIVGVYFLVTNEIQLGTLLTVIIYGQLLTKPLKKVSSTIISLETSFSSIKQIFAIINFKNKE